MLCKLIRFFNSLETDHLTCRVFFFAQNFFFGQHEQSEIFFQNLTLGYMSKTLNQIIFFLHQNQNIFSATLGIRIYFFLEKKHSPLPRKLSGPSLRIDELKNLKIMTQK